MNLLKCSFIFAGNLCENLPVLSATLVIYIFSQLSYDTSNYASLLQHNISASNLEQPKHSFRSLVFRISNRLDVRLLEA